MWRARQLAIAHHTTVYMVFLPAGYWTDPAYNPATWNDEDRAAAQGLLDKQLTAYNFVSLRSLGDQPGRPTTRYLGEWKTLPDGVFIPLQKFGFRTATPNMVIYTNAIGGPMLPAYSVYGFEITTNVPFPLATTRPASAQIPSWTRLPYIAFNYMGQLVSGQDEMIPLALGRVGYSRNQATKVALAAVPSVTEMPRGNSTNAYNLVHIDWLTGRARVERQEVR